MATKTAKKSGKIKKDTSGYSAEQITVLEGLDPVRKRPGMYIGTTGAAGLHHLVWEVVDNSIDEAMAGYCTEIIVRLLPDNRVSVEDNGRGIPVDIHKQFKKSALELVLTKLHAGGKFGGSGYKVSGGLHGVGVSVVNALSTWMKAEVKRQGKLWVQEYKTGKPVQKVRPVGNAKGTGTTITFEPDPTIFPTIAFDWQTILDHLRQQAYLTKGVRIEVIDEREKKKGQQYIFHFEGGIKSYVRHLNHHKDVKHPTVFYVDKEMDARRVEVALQYVEDFKESAFAFANNIFNPEGGTHVIGFRTALTRTINHYARTKGFLKEKDENLSGEDVREGLTVVVSVKLQEPQFEGQTKGKLGNDDIRPIVETVFANSFSVYLEEHPRDAEQIIGKCVLAARARVAARMARESVLRKGALEGFTLPGKLADCSSRSAEKSEIFIVEGDSAGGCFSADTKVALLDGRSLSFIDLIREQRQGKRHYCYTIKDNGSIGVGEIRNPRRTKRTVRVVAVTLDTGERITCTPDHKFLLRDGTYKEARHLTPYESLMPLRRQISRIGKRITIQGYEMVFDPQQYRWLFTHMLADAHNLETGAYTTNDGAHRHHNDFNKRNNNPDNLTRLSKEEHLSLHALLAEKTIHRQDVKDKLRLLRKTPAFREKLRRTMTQPAMRAMLRERAKKQWEDKEYKEFMRTTFLHFYNSTPAYRITNNKQLNRAQKKYWSKQEHRTTQAERVKRFFQEHPEQKEILAHRAQEQWNDPTLRSWRSKKTKEQWTKAFRAHRKKAYDQTYLRKALAVLRDIRDRTGVINIDAYNEVRRSTKDRSLIRFSTICDRFFSGDQKKLAEAVTHYNHKVASVEYLSQSMDVYDLEVPGTHNFALASGVFVHNSAKQGRNREFQAILPLRGKILNVERARIDKLLANNELRALIVAMGTNIGEQLDISKLRYHKIVLMTDADVDGAHIRTLLLTFYWRHFPDLILKGHLYIAQPPLYRIQKGKEMRYAYSEADKEKTLRALGVKGEDLDAPATEMTDEENEETEERKDTPNAKKTPGVSIQRYKGLGEMNPEQLWETTMDPDRRVLLQVTSEDAEKADEIFTTLMGSEVAPRKRFITAHAKAVKNLDI